MRHHAGFDEPLSMSGVRACMGDRHGSLAIIIHGAQSRALETNS